MDQWSICVPAVPSMVPVARRFTRAYLAGHPLADDAALITSQYTANAIQHPAAGHGGAISVTVTATGDRVRIEVTSHAPATQMRAPAPGPTLPAGRASTEDYTGRGLLLVDAIAHRWGHHGSAGHDTAWAEIRHVPVHPARTRRESPGSEPIPPLTERNQT